MKFFRNKLTSAKRVKTSETPGSINSATINVLLGADIGKKGSGSAEPENQHLASLYEEIEKLNIAIHPFSRKALLQRCDVVHIHWPEWLVRWHEIPFALFDIVTVLGLLYFARARGAAIVWTAHNLEPHEVTRPRLWRLYNAIFQTQLDLAISLNGAGPKLLSSRYPRLQSVPFCVVPHGHYCNQYARISNTADVRRNLELDEKPTLLCFGQIRPYKNIPMLVRAWKELPLPRPQLVVAGRTSSSDLEQAIRVEALGVDDIRLLLSFVSKEEVSGIFSVADAVVAPYDSSSALNSGVAHLALSLSTPAVVNDNPANRYLQEVFGAEWIWLCNGTPEDAMRAALDAVSASRPEKPDLSMINYDRLATMTRQAYLDAIQLRRV